MVAVRTKSKSTAKSTKTTSRPAAKPTKTTRTTATRTTAKKPVTTKAAPKRATATRTTTTRTTAKPTTRSTAKAPATRTRKKVEVTPTRTAKAANRRGPAATKPKSAADTRKKTTSRSVKTVAKPSTPPTTGPNRVVDDTTGFAIGTDSHVIATELLKGGETRAEIIERCAKKLPATSNRGTPKPVANMVASVLGKMRDAGFTVSSSFILEPPTRASKARATRERNKRLNGG